MMRPARLRMQLIRCRVRSMPARLSPPKVPTCSKVRTLGACAHERVGWHQSWPKHTQAFTKDQTLLRAKAEKKKRQYVKAVVEA
eukprot:1159163-Pelagomonas_calceolata.AAC.2